MLLLGFVTLLVFPIPTFLYFGWIGSSSLIALFQFENASILNIGLGLEFGFVYGFLALFLLKAPVFDKLPTKIEDLVRSMNLNWGDALFLSFYLFVQVLEKNYYSVRECNIYLVFQ
jgi:hypothetical protein